MHELATSRLRLRPLDDTHFEACFALDQDPEVMRYISDGRVTPREEFTRELWPRLTARASEDHGFYAGLELTDGVEAFIGWFHLRPSVRLAGELEVGYRLARAATGRGLATEGTRVLLRHAFGKLDRALVDACVRPDNLPSRRVLERCGFEPCGRFVHPRAAIEVEHYVLMRERYREPKRGAFELDEQVRRHYQDLYTMASAALRRRNDARTLDPSEVVHDCYLRLARSATPTPARRTEFLALAASVVRSVLVDRARERSTSKRGGELRRVTLDGELAEVPTEVEVLVLDEALQVLAQLDARQAAIVELKYFARLSIDEIAALLGCSVRTVHLDWAHARAWLHRELGP